MRFLILGASGRVGKLVVEEALSRGHNVTALVRNKSSLSSLADNSSHLTIVQGQPTESVDMERAFGAVPGDIPSVILVTLNSVRASDSPFAKQVSPPTLMHDTHVVAMESMQRNGVQKLVTLQALGVGDSYPNLSCLVKPLLRHSNMGIGYKDHEMVEEIVKRSNVTYVLVRPIRLVEGDAAPIKFYGNHGEGIGGFDSITRSSVAEFLVDAAERNHWDGMTPVLSN